MGTQSRLSLTFNPPAGELPGTSHLVTRSSASSQKSTGPWTAHHSGSTCSLGAPHSRRRGAFSQHVHPPGTGHPPRPPSAPCCHGPGLSMQWGLCSTIRPVTQLRPETCHLRLRKRGPLGDKLGQGHVATTETRTKVSATRPMRTEPGAHPSGRHQAPSPTERPRSGSCCHLDGTRNRSPAKGYTGRQPLTHRGAWGGANQG